MYIDSIFILLWFIHCSN